MTPTPEPTSPLTEAQHMYEAPLNAHEIEQIRRNLFIDDVAQRPTHPKNLWVQQMRMLATIDALTPPPTKPESEPSAPPGTIAVCRKCKEPPRADGKCGGREIHGTLVFHPDRCPLRQQSIAPISVEDARKAQAIADKPSPTPQQGAGEAVKNARTILNEAKRGSTRHNIDHVEAAQAVLDLTQALADRTRERDEAIARGDDALNNLSLTNDLYHGWKARAETAESSLREAVAREAVLVDSIEIYGDEYAKSSIIWHDRDGMHCSICNRTWDRDSQSGAETHAKDCPVHVAKNRTPAAQALLTKVTALEAIDFDALRKVVQQHFHSCADFQTVTNCTHDLWALLGKKPIT